MGLTRRISSLFKPKRDEEKSTNFIQNGSELLADLIAFSNGQYDIPIRTFSAEELVRATKSFSKLVFTDKELFRGQFEGRQILVIRWTLERNFAVRDVVIASQMSHHKNVLKLVGCCLEFEYLCSVHEYVDGTLLSDLLEHPSYKRLLSWRSRIRIASDIASTILYLHTNFSTPVIYRNLKPSRVIINQHGVAKLFDFTYCISLPPGKLGVDDIVVGTHGFADPEYVASGYVTQKIDVYSFGVFLLTLLTGKTAFWYNHEGDGVILLEYVKYFADNHQYDQLIDPSILEQVERVGNEDQLQSFLDLALRCTRDERDERPEMIDVAKQLRLMEKALPNPNTLLREASGN